MDIQRLVIANPSGNITAIVFDPTPRENMRDVGAIIQSSYPHVEQVLFVEKKGSKIHGQMAGGEFCGNAARALGYVLANGKDSQQTFTMSGVSAPVTVDVSKGRATLTTRMALKREEIDFEGAKVPVVHLEGISHAIMLPEHPLFSFLKRYAERPDRWETVAHVLEDLSIKNKPASGLIFAEQNGNGTSITPYVYVSAINTLYPEMACASGSVAAAFALGKGVTLRNGVSIHQPSGNDLVVSVKLVGSQTEIKVAGNMAVIGDGLVENLHYTEAALVGRHGVAMPSHSAPQPARATL
jgi:diaminopimelate epimerase